MNEDESMQVQMPKVTIKSDVAMRTVTTKQGTQMPIYSQRAELESEKMRMEIEVIVDGLQQGYSVGAVKFWDVVSDLVPGRFGIDLSRKKTLVDANASGSGRSSPSPAPVSSSKGS
ncbi:hypothetical protein [Xylella fastidiosa]|uniref:hypothetical protein n=1 Tax=Xylella fastidiosa TaxID=2371 RepID=UPI001E2C4F5B|nr:hypothetical protein [Xylella fastidiosa]MDG5822167.1 hypothetical protein [Xylella fastidiosa subsp. pauca]MDG5825655.1 hypothetical protein [Xylella fastidiosa subsp. pauca]